MVRVYLAQYKLTPDPVPGFINLMSRLLSALSPKPRLVSASGCGSDLFECLDRIKYFSQGVQCPFRFNVRSFPVILRQADGTVFGAIDFLSQLKYLIVFLGGCQDQPWAIKSPELSSVSPFHLGRKNWVWALLVYILIILSGCYFLQFGVEFQSSVVCSELLVHWKSILDYITKVAPSQVMQGVPHKVRAHYCIMCGYNS